MAAHVAIFSLSQDLHGHMVAEHIRQLGHRCQLIATDQLAHRPSVTWYSNSQSSLLETPCVYDMGGEVVNIQSLTTVWWRRVIAPVASGEYEDTAAATLVPVECRTAVMGALLTSFSGRWVNDPAAEIRGDNKLVQLAAAQAVGMTIPRTLVSSDPQRIRSFVAAQPGGQAVVKVVRGTGAFSVPARLVGADDMQDDAALQACPAMYQEVVQGQSHLRIHVFGTTITAIRIESPHLDWRPDLHVPMQAVELPTSLQTALVQLVRRLGLCMGIVDAKITPEGSLVFLEINPQGQFAFMEGLTGVPLSLRMAEFLAQPAC